MTATIHLSAQRAARPQTTRRPGLIRGCLVIGTLLLVAVHLLRADPMGRFCADLERAGHPEYNSICTKGENH